MTSCHPWHNHSEDTPLATCPRLHDRSLLFSLHGNIWHEMTSYYMIWNYMKWFDMKWYEMIWNVVSLKSTIRMNLIWANNVKRILLHWTKKKTAPRLGPDKNRYDSIGGQNKFHHIKHLSFAIYGTMIYNYCNIYQPSTETTQHYGRPAKKRSHRSLGKCTGLEMWDLNNSLIESYSSKLHGGFLSHRAAPSHHPFSMGIFPYETHPIGSPISGKLHMAVKTVYPWHQKSL